MGPDSIWSAVRTLGAAGLVVTLNSDDPAPFQTTLTGGRELAHRAHGLSRETPPATQLAAVAASYADSAAKARIRTALEGISGSL